MVAGSLKIFGCSYRVTKVFHDRREGHKAVQSQRTFGEYMCCKVLATSAAHALLEACAWCGDHATSWFLTAEW